MGYFNYFIRCIIRNIAYKLCKPKVFLTVLLSVSIFFGLKHFGYCVLDDTDYEMIADGFATVTQNQGVIISQLSSMGVDVSDIENDLNSVKSDISQIETNTNNIASTVADIYLKLNSINNNIINIYNQLEENQKELISELEQQNDTIVEELESIKSILSGSVSTFSGVTFNSTSFAYGNPAPSSRNYNYTMSVVDNSAVNFGYTTFNGFEYLESNTTYTFSLVSGGTPGTGTNVFYTYDDVSVGNSCFLRYLGNYGVGNSTFTITNTTKRKITLIFNNPSAFSGSVWEVSVSQAGILDGINSSINEQGQNINNSITNSDVDIDSSTLPSDDTQDITQDGFNNIFNQLYNTFTSGSAQDVVITIPFTNKSFVINRANVYGSANLGFIKTIIEAFWYFIISYFIVRDVGKKINKIKSGNIESVQNTNIKEDLL